MTTPSDPLYLKQWHFPLIGDIETIWNEYSGKGVHVGVYDTGVEYTHEDLAGNYDASLHFTYDGVVYDPVPIDKTAAHATSVAGLIGAVMGNGLGGTGVAWGVTITGVDYLDRVQLESYEVNFAALDWAAKFDIMSNSWGVGSDFGGEWNLSYSFSTASLFNEHYQTVAQTGRNGLGTVIVQAAGNDHMDANGSGLNASRFTATIAATDKFGNAEYYSNYGAGILVTAPAAGVTTDVSGKGGYNYRDSTTNPVDYTSQFNGTSAATPVVSGVVALMLDANPDLGWRDVHNILALSASHTGSSFGSEGAGFEVGAWESGSGKQWNGGGSLYHLSYGYGMVDAFAAVRMAEAWLMMSDRAATSGNELTASGAYSGSAVAIPDYQEGLPGQVSLAAEVSKNVAIETAMVTIELSHSAASDLEIGLQAPDGRIFPLLALGYGDALMDDGFSWTFEVAGLRGYDSAGTWKLVVKDAAAEDIGTVSAFSIDFYGARASSDDVHTFTSDFSMLAAQQPERTLFADTNGGEDWLNFAAVADNIIADMSAGGYVRVGSTLWGRIAGGSDTFENFVSSDGNDQINGNSLDNQLFGMRGHDHLYGGMGDDVLDGGVGLDTLEGGGGDDFYVLLENEDPVIEQQDSGNDTVLSYQENYVLPDHVEQGVIMRDGAANLTGNSLNNTLYAGVGDNVLDGGDGADTVSYEYGLSGNQGVSVNLAYEHQFTEVSGLDRLINIENLIGSARADSLTGNELANVLQGAGGNDTLDGGSGADSLLGGGGNDIYLVDDSADVVSENANEGTDLVYSYLSAYTLPANVESAWVGLEGDGNLTGNALDNFLYAGRGNNILDGGAGRDTVSFTYGMAVASGVVASLVDGKVSGGSGDDTLKNIESLYGSAYADMLTGNGLANNLVGDAGNDRLMGGGGQDSLIGGQGNDILAGGGGLDLLIGGKGNDVLTGGAGRDVFRFESPLSAKKNVDRINDFVAADDTLELNNAIFLSLSGTGALSADNFVAGSGQVAVDADDYLIYDSLSGKLFYDADGNGAELASQIAIVGINLPLSASNFMVI